MRNGVIVKERTLKNPQPYGCEWRVPKAGFKWITALEPSRHEAPQRFLVENWTPPLKPYESRTYDPIKSYSGLFRNFAELEPTEESFLQFANKYGALGISIGHMLDVDWSEMGIVPAVCTEGGEPVPESGSFGESYADWFHSALFMRALVFLWQAADNADLPALTKHLDCSDENAVCFTIAYSYRSAPFIFWADASDRTRRAVRERNYVEVAHDIVRTQISRHVEAKVVLRQTESATGIFIEASNLLSALWLQFAFAVAGQHVYRTCEHCGNYFQIGPNGEMRSDAVFCSNACRQAKYRKKVVTKKLRKGKQAKKP
jgi:hypothetical protein